VTLKPQNHVTCRVRRHIPRIGEVGTVWDDSFLSYAPGKQTNRRTQTSYPRQRTLQQISELRKQNLFTELRPETHYTYGRTEKSNGLKVAQMVVYRGSHRGRASRVYIFLSTMFTNTFCNNILLSLVMNKVVYIYNVFSVCERRWRWGREREAAAAAAADAAAAVQGRVVVYQPTRR